MIYGHPLFLWSFVNRSPLDSEEELQGSIVTGFIPNMPDLYNGYMLETPRTSYALFCP